MASFEDYRKHLKALKVEQKIARVKRNLETLNYGDECPFGCGENDCAPSRKAFDWGYVNGLYDALNMLGLGKDEALRKEGE